MTEDEKRRETEQLKKQADAELFAKAYLDEVQRREDAKNHPKISIADQESLNNNIASIADGRATVTDGSEPAKLGAKEVSASDPKALGENLLAIATGEKVVAGLSRR